jgi:hypothetical protein
MCPLTLPSPPPGARDSNPLSPLGRGQGKGAVEVKGETA